VNPVTLLVNGTTHEVACDPDTPLLYVLRNDLGLVGAKFGCGLGLCGACNVLVDGHPTHSCDTPVWAVAGKQVTTVEGLAGHPLQETFVDEQALQCEDGVRRALDGNLCRCGAHNRVVRAVLGARPSAR
jgi:nicotinate dehydrogenase subunit A